MSSTVVSSKPRVTNSCRAVRSSSPREVVGLRPMRGVSELGDRGTRFPFFSALSAISMADIAYGTGCHY
jgi:hypothetical protein